MLRNLRYALRQHTRAPAVTAVAVVALGLGIGANSVCFTFINSLLLHPLPFRDLGSLVRVWQTYPQRGFTHDMVSAPDFLDWREQARSFAHLAAFSGWDANLTGVDEPERLEGFAVSADFFPALGMPPLLGRTFTRAEEQPGNNQVVILSHGFWQRRFASDPQIIGRTISLNGLHYAVVAVMPPDFDFPLSTDVWCPLLLGPEQRAVREARYLFVLGRLAPGHTLDQARAEMDSIAAGLASQYPRTNGGRGVRIQTIRSVINQVTDRFTMVLMAAAGFVLLLACANVANIQLSRVLSRQKEMALRATLGAGRWHVIRQMMTESALLAGAGAVAGLLLASWDISIFPATIPPEVFKWVPGMKHVKVDGTVLAFSAGLALLTAILCGIAPALQACRRVDLGEALKEGGRIAAGGERHPLRKALVAAEVALALLLLVAAGLMVKTFRGMMVFDLGYQPRHLLTLSTSLPAAHYGNPARVRAFYEQSVEHIGRLPQVIAAGSSGGDAMLSDFRVVGQPPREAREAPPGMQLVTGDYLTAMGIPILAGRAITSADGGAAPKPVAVISDSVARRYWGSTARALGGRFEARGYQFPVFTVVGVSGDLKEWFSKERQSTIYLPCALMPQFNASFAIRTRGNPADVAPAVREAIHKLDREQPVYDLTTGEKFLDAQTSGVRAAAGMMSVFAAIALLLAVTGIYGVVSYAVAQRTHEIGIRLALGAQPAGVLRMVILQALRIAAAGLAIGLVAAFLLTHAMASALYGVISLDVFTFAGFAVLLAAAAGFAAWLPARRATRIDPMQALRYE